MKSELKQVTDEQYGKALQGMIEYFDKDSHTADDHRQASKHLARIEEYTRQEAREVAKLRQRIRVARARIKALNDKRRADKDTTVEVNGVTDEEFGRTED